MKTETTNRPEYEVANEQAKSLFESLGITATVSQPRPAVRDNDWPCIEYDVNFTNGRKSWTAQYRIGVGHVKIPRSTSCNLMGLTNSEESLLYALQNNPHAKAKDPSLHASLATKLAKAQKVTLSCFEVFAQCCNDGLSAQDQSFENWAADFGYDADSRKAEKIYDECRAVWFEVLALAGEANVRKLAELASQF